MTQRIRTFYFFLTIAAFVVVTPLLILYASGFRIDWQSRSVLQTGVVRISSIPKSASVQIDASPKTKITPAHFSALLPGGHSIRVSKSGYYPWIGRISIEAQRSVVINEAVLFQSAQGAVASWPNPIGPSAFHAQTDRLAFIDVESGNLVILSEKTGEAVFRFTARPGVEDIDWSPQGKRLLLTRPQADADARYSWIALEPGAQETPILSPEPFERIWWGNHVDDLLYANTAASLVRYDLLTKTGSVLLPFQAADWMPYQSGAYVVAKTDEEEKLYWFDPTKAEPEPLATLEHQPAKLVPGYGGWFGIIDSAQNCWLYRHVSSGVLERQSLPNRCSFLEMHPEGNYVVSGDSYELHVYSLQTGKSATLTRQSTPYTGATWYPRGEVLLFFRTDKIEAIDFSNQYPVQTVLSAVQHPQLVGLDLNGQSLFMTTGSEPTLKQLQLQSPG